VIPHNSVFAPILTPFDDSGANIDTAAFTQHLQYLTNAGLDGVLVLGTNGEFAHLRDTEKSELVDLALQIEELQVIAGGTVPDSIEGTLALCSALNKHGSRLAGILVAPPFYGEYKSGHKISEKTIAEFYRALAQLVLDVPLYLYNVPRSSEKQVTAAVSPAVMELLGDVAIAGLKDSTGIAGNVPDYLSARPDLNILIGNDHAISEGISAGARGSITACANVFPSAVKTLYGHLHKPGEKQAQDELSVLRGVLEIIPGKMIAAQKLLLHIFGVVSQHSPVRIPGGSLTEPEKNRVLGQIGQICSTLEINQGLGRELAQKAADYR